MTTPTIPVVNAGELYVNTLALGAAGGTSTVTMGDGSARDSTNTNDIVLSSTVTIDGSTLGVNGADTAVITTNTFYAVYVIGDSTGYNAAGGLLSLSSSSPNLPSGYDMFRRVGWVLTDGSSKILKFAQYGQATVRWYYYDVGISELSAGAATSFTAVNLATSVPPIPTQVILDALYTPNSATNVAEFLPFGSTATNGIVKFGYGVAAAQRGMVTVPVLLNGAVPTIQYKVATSDTLTLLAVGYIDSL